LTDLLPVLCICLCTFYPIKQTIKDQNFAKYHGTIWLSVEVACEF